MCITHGDLEIGVTEDSLKRENIPSINQKVTRESVPQNMSELPIG
jgi:hypothetical protein